jgi:hypothetical protein
MEEAIVTAIVFAGIYQVIKVFTDFLLKKRIIASGHVEKAGILNPAESKEQDVYPTLKWGLITLFAGAGLLAIALLDKSGNLVLSQPSRGYLSFGIELMAISLGFLIYFMILRLGKK